MQGHVMSHEQAARTIPGQILASSVLAMNAAELAQYVCEQVAENPALAVEETEFCPVCGTPISEYTCPLCGAEPVDTGEQLEGYEEDWDDESSLPAIVADPEDDFDPFVLIASPIDLFEHLRSQARMAFSDDKQLQLALFIIDALDADGYFREDISDIAHSHNISVPQAEEVLQAIQQFDPPGIAARDARECLLLQLKRLEDEPFARLTASLIETSWEDLAKLKIPAIAQRLEVEVEDIKKCIYFMRDHLNPRPASLYRAPWSELSPSSVGQIVPDVVIRMRGESPVVEILDFQAGLLKLDEDYEAAAEGNGFASSSEDRKRVKEFVDKARCVLDAVQLRRKTLAKIAVALADYQKDYLLLGPRGLKPLKQKELAANIGIHESTVCRALNGKFARIPSGEVVPFDVFFDSSLPIKEMMRTMLASSDGDGLSDSEIARRLEEQGITIARRTVAKYRDQLRLPNYQFR